MMTEYEPRPEFLSRLEASTARRNDFVLYCRSCEWVGETNAAHARSSVCPECRDYSVRIWQHTVRR